MPLTTTEFDLEETLEQKQSEKETLVEEAAKLDPQNPAFPERAQRGNTLDTHIAGLQWAIENWDVDTITLAGLTGGEYAKLENELGSDSNGSGDARIATIVHGSEDAPYLVTDDDGELDEPKTYYEVGQLPLAIQKFLEHEVNERTSVGNVETTFAQLLVEERHRVGGGEE